MASMGPGQGEVVPRSAWCPCCSCAAPQHLCHTLTQPLRSCGSSPTAMGKEGSRPVLPISSNTPPPRHGPLGPGSPFLFPLQTSGILKK